jgi:nitroreductase
MPSLKPPPKSEIPVSALDAIYRRRAVRDYAPGKIGKAVIEELLDAAVHAPTAMHLEPWSFVIVQDKALLNHLSNGVKNLIRRELEGSHTHRAQHELELVNNADFNVFYNAETLVVICGKGDTPYIAGDCWLAAENLMLAACAKGLGTCPIGFAIPALNTPEWKAELKIPPEATAVAAIIVGAPAGETPPSPRKLPEILAWK